MIPLAELIEFEAPTIEREIRTNKPLDAPDICLHTLRQLAYIFAGRSMDAPNLFIAGGLLHDNTPVSGAGSGLRSALLRMTGEATEQLSLREAPPLAPPDLPFQLQSHINKGVDAHPLLAKSWRNGTLVQVPGNLLPYGKGYAGFSEGLGSHPDPAQALRHGIFELIERNAVRLWWSGNTDATRILGTEPLVAKELGAPRERSTLLLDVTNESKASVFVAASFDRNGRSFCFGAAASYSSYSAMRSALRELGATEFGLSLARMFRPNDGGPKSNDQLLADRVDRDPFLSNLTTSEVEMGCIDSSTRRPSAADWTTLLSELDIYSIHLQAVGPNFHTVKVVSEFLNPVKSDYTNQELKGGTTQGDGFFGVPIY